MNLAVCPEGYLMSIEGWALAPAALASLCLVAAAEPRALTGDELMATVADKKVVIDTPVGPVPIEFHADGTLVGHSKEVARYVGVEHDTGKWWVSGDKLRVCQKWRVWLEGKLHCYSLGIDGAVVHWSRSDGEKGLARIAAIR